MSNVLIVSGGSRGIGAATALLGAKRGYKVAVNYNSNPGRAEDVVKQITAAGGHAIAIKADVSVEADVVRLFETVDKELGTVTALFNNAGIVLPVKPITDCTADELDRLWRINITSQFICAREAVRRMSTESGGKGGAIVNMSSAAAYIGGPGGSEAYAASKGAIDTFTRGLSIDLGPLGIRVNAIRPGLIDTEIHDDMGVKDRVKTLAPSIPMRRPGTAQEVAETVLWLLSEQASYVNGSIVNIGGGR